MSGNIFAFLRQAGDMELPNHNSMLFMLLLLLALAALIPLALFYFFRDRDAVLRKLRSLVPLTEGETDQVLAWVNDMGYTSVFGTVLVALVLIGSS